MTLSSEAFDRNAPHYRRSRPYYPESMIDWLRDLLGPQRTDLAIDVGCGPGTLSLPLSRCFRRTLALDLSRSMLAELHEAVRSQTQLGCLVGLQARGEAFPVAESVAHLVACSQSLHWMQCATVVQEARRVLRPGGALLVCWQEWMVPDSCVERVYRQGWRLVAGDAPARDPARPRMQEVAATLELEPSEKYSKQVVLAMTPDQLATFFLSRASTSGLDHELRLELESHWTRLAQQQLGTTINYTFTVGARFIEFA